MVKYRAVSYKKDHIVALYFTMSDIVHKGCKSRKLFSSYLHKIFSFEVENENMYLFCPLPIRQTSKYESDLFGNCHDPKNFSGGESGGPCPPPLPDFADIKKRTEAEIYNLHTHIFGHSAASEFN